MDKIYRVLLECRVSKVTIQDIGITLAKGETTWVSKETATRSRDLTYLVGKGMIWTRGEYHRIPTPPQKNSPKFEAPVEASPLNLPVSKPLVVTSPEPQKQAAPPVNQVELPLPVQPTPPPLLDLPKPATEVNYEINSDVDCVVTPDTEIQLSQEGDSLSNVTVEAGSGELQDLLNDLEGSAEESTSDDSKDFRRNFKKKKKN